MNTRKWVRTRIRWFVLIETMVKTRIILAIYNELEQTGVIGIVSSENDFKASKPFRCSKNELMKQAESLATRVENDEIMPRNIRQEHKNVLGVLHATKRIRKIGRSYKGNNVQ